MIQSSYLSSGRRRAPEDKRIAGFVFRRCPHALRWIVTLTLLFILQPVLMAASDWPPLAPSDLTTQVFPAQSGASAVILDQTIDCDHTKDVETHFVRIKVLTEAGENQGSIRIPYDQSQSEIADVDARTVEPDGTVVPFTGQVFDSVIAQARSLRMHEKTFSMPDVRVGSVLDYRYRVVWHRKFPLLTPWKVQSDLFVRHERFSVQPLQPLQIDWISVGLNNQHQPVRHKEPDSTVTMEESNIPPFVDEPYSLPQAVRVKAVVLFYSFGLLHNADDYWAKFGLLNAKATEKFIGKPKEVERWVAGIVQGVNKPEGKLRAIYAYLQTLRNLTDESVQPGGIPDAKQLKQNNSVKDVLKHQYGGRDDINKTFVALARAAGFDAWYVFASSRDAQFFTKNVPDGDQLDSSLAEVKVDGKDEFFDPGLGCPFGVIPWARTAVTGMRLDQLGGTFETTAPPSSTQATVTRKGDFQLALDGTLQGELKVGFGGDAAFLHTAAAVEMDDAARSRSLVDEVRSWLPKGAEVRLEKVNGWHTWEPVLEATFSVKAPGFAVAAGSRLLLPQGVLETTLPQMFPAPHRQGVIYFHEPWRTADEVRIELPPGFHVESVPRPATTPAASALHYSAVEEVGPNILQWHRALAVDNILFPVKSYPGVRAFFTEVRQNDRLQVVLQQKPPVPQTPQS